MNMITDTATAKQSREATVAAIANQLVGPALLRKLDRLDPTFRN